MTGRARPVISACSAARAHGLVEQAAAACGWLPTVAFDDDEQGLATANDNHCGFGRSVRNADVERAAALAVIWTSHRRRQRNPPFDTKDLRTPYSVRRGQSDRDCRMLAAAGLPSYSAEFVRAHGDLNQAAAVLMRR